MNAYLDIEYDDYETTSSLIIAKEVDKHHLKGYYVYGSGTCYIFNKKYCVEFSKCITFLSKQYYEV